MKDVQALQSVLKVFESYSSKELLNALETVQKRLKTDGEK